MNKRVILLMFFSALILMTGCGKAELSAGLETAAGRNEQSTIIVSQVETVTDIQPTDVTDIKTEVETETETETETEAATDTENIKGSIVSDEETEQMVQARLALQYASDVGRVSLDQELFETHMGELGNKLAGQQGELSEYQLNILNACAVTPPAGPHYCAAWVSSVFENAGIYDVGGNANDMWDEYCYSSDISELEPGMIIATLHSRTDQDSDGYIYGHCGIYIGSGYVIQSTTVYGEGRKIITSLDDWLDRYDPYDTVKWGYPYN